MSGGLIPDALHFGARGKKAKQQTKQACQNLQTMLEGAIQTSTLMVETRDRYSAGHHQRVAQLASATAREFNFSDDRIQSICIAGLLHDIGKIFIPIEILGKPGRLNETELAIVRTHPRAGYDILKQIDFPWPIADAVLQHHERMDGSGYPSGIADEEILLEARILGVADVVEAMCSRRPYRPALGLDRALMEITEQKGSLYDSDVVDACSSLFKGKGFAFPDQPGMPILGVTDQIPVPTRSGSAVPNAAR